MKTSTTARSGAGFHACVALTVISAAILLAPIGTAVAQGSCLTPLVPNEPLCSPALADSPWPISHSGAYAQGSSALPGPVAGQSVVAEHVVLTGPPITLAMSPGYADGGRAIWGAVLGITGAVVKIDSETFQLVDTYVPADEEADPPALPLGVSGAYSAVDRDFNFILGRANFVEIFRDSIPGDRSSPIELAKRVFLPKSAFCRDDDLLVGGVILPDGFLAFVSEQAGVGVIPTDIDDMDAANTVTLPSENGASCDDLTVAEEDLEIVSNSMAADESGGFYIVTNRAVVKYHWDGVALEKIWRAEYASDPPISVLRLGPGSGSTPSLMGTEIDDDRFVVITDGQELMHLVLLWRDEIPDDWQPIAAGKDRRIACEIPVTFGDPAATRTLSEQSVLVRGYGAVVVNNLLTDESSIDTSIPALAAAFAALEGGNSELAPFGIERFDWDPESRTCKSVWANTELSIPNGIPTMSGATGLMYALGLRDGIWGLEGISFATGTSELFIPSLQQPCSQEEIDQLANSTFDPFLSPIVERLPGSCENSFFAATEIGPDGVIYQGTFQGASRFVPASVVELSERRQAIAGAEQGVDLANRALAALGTDLELARERIRRGQTQLVATTVAIASAAAGALLDASSSAAALAGVEGALDRFLSSEAILESDPGGVEAELADGLAELSAALDSLTPCAPLAQSGCRDATSSKLLMKPGRGEKSKLIFKWSSNSAIDPGELPDPTAEADYAVCLYAGSAAARNAALSVPADAQKWSARKKGDGFQYKDKEGAPSGISKAQIREAGGKALALFKGKGTNLAEAPLPAETPVTIQVVNSETGLCWQARYEASDIKKNEPGLFSAKSAQ